MFAFLTLVAAQAAPMSGYGGGLSTTGVPNHYPLKLPDAPSSFGYGYTTWDVHAVGRYLQYRNKTQRVGGRAQLGGGSGWMMAAADVGFDQVLLPKGPTNVFAGVGAGGSHQRFTDTNGDVLKVNSVLARVDVGVIHRMDTWAIEGQVFAVLPWALSEQYGGQELSGGRYPQVGVEATVLVGDFKLKPKKNKKKK